MSETASVPVVAPLAYKFLLVPGGKEYSIGLVTGLTNIRRVGAVTFNKEKNTWPDFSHYERFAEWLTESLSVPESERPVTIDQAHAIWHAIEEADAIAKKKQREWWTEMTASLSSTE